MEFFSLSRTRSTSHRNKITKTIYALILGLAISVDAAEPLLVDEKLVASGKIDIRPDYPAEAQAERLTGAGVFILHVNQFSGRVVSVEIGKSTGHKILDQAAVAKFSNLRFKPDTVSRVKIPVEFTLPPQSQKIQRARGFPAMVLLRPERPSAPGRGTGGGRK